MFRKKFKNRRVEFLFKFTVNIVVLIGLWFLFYNLIRKWNIVDFIYEQGIYFLTKIQLILSDASLSLMGFVVEIYGKTVKIVGSYGVHLDRGCLGRNTLGLFVGFILAFPGKVKSKVWFIAVGIIIFIMMNVLRIDALAITDYCCRERLDFNHHFVFKIIIYIVIFFMWVWWIQRYSIFADKNNDK